MKCLLLAVPCLVLASTVLATPADPGGDQAITRGPYLQALLETSVAVLWRTEFPSVGGVRVVSDRDGERVVRESAPTDTHELAVSGLSPDTTYRYEILDGDRVLASRSELGFRTAPRPGDGVVRAAVIGDSGWNGPAQHAITRVLESLDFQLFLHTGDLIYTGDLDTVVFSEYRTILSRSCLYPTRGNHTFIPYSDWHAVFSPPAPDTGQSECAPPVFDCPEPAPPGARRPVFYSLDWGSAHFVVVDSNADFAACSAQLDWLCSDLASATERGIPWRVIILHQHPYTTGSNKPGDARDLIPPIADRFAVDLVLAGHDHNYQRTHPVRAHAALARDDGPFYYEPPGTFYVVTGGGGGLPYAIFETAEDHSLFKVAEMAYHAVELEFSPDWLEVRALRSDRTVLDHFVVSKTRDSSSIPFIRGDVDFSGAADLTDAVRILEHLFRGKPVPCVPVADTNTTPGTPLEVDLADAVFLLGHLFQGGAAPSPPYPDCGTSPELTRLECRCTCAQGCPG